MKADIFLKDFSCKIEGELIYFFYQTRASLARAAFYRGISLMKPALVLHVLHLKGIFYMDIRIKPCKHSMRPPFQAGYPFDYKGNPF